MYRTPLPEKRKARYLEVSTRIDEMCVYFILLDPVCYINSRFWFTREALRIYVAATRLPRGWCGLQSTPPLPPTQPREGQGGCYERCKGYVVIAGVVSCERQAATALKKLLASPCLIFAPLLLRPHRLLYERGARAKSSKGAIFPRLTLVALQEANAWSVLWGLAANDYLIDWCGSNK